MTEIPDEPSEEERQAFAAFLAYRDAPNEATEAALLRAVPGEGGLWLRDAAKRLGDQPSLWNQTLRRLVARGLRPPEAVAAHVAWYRTVLRRSAERASGEASRSPAIPLDEPSDEEVLALDAYLSEPNEETGAALLRAVPGEGGLWLRDAVKKLRDHPSLWASAPPPASVSFAPFALPARGVDRSRHRPARRLPQRSVTKTVVTVAAVPVILTAAILVTTFSSQSPPGPVAIPAVHAAWQLAGFIDQPAWQASGSTPGILAAAVTCPSGPTCYADQPGSTQSSGVVEGTTDGGSIWQASLLPAGAHLTSELACPADDHCLVAGYAQAAAGPGAPTGESPAIFVTTDGGTSWSVQPLASGVAQVTNLACASPTDCVGAGYGPIPTADSLGPSVAVVTTDGGSSWVVVALPGPFVADPGGLACPTVQTCVLAGATSFSTATGGSSTARGAALYSTDGGRSWSPAVVPATVVGIRAVSCPDADYCVALGNPTGSGSLPYGPSEALTSTDGGETWSLVGSTGLVPASLVSISCPTPADCWATGRLATSRSGAIVVTHDAGATWTTVALPTTPPPAQQRATGLSQLDIEDVASVSCPIAGTCIALAGQGSLNPPEQQIALRTDGP